MKPLFLAVAVLATITFSTANSTEKILDNFKLGNKIFSAEVLADLVKTEPGNFMYCPFSVKTVLALAASGAKNETLKQMTDFLRIPETEEEIRVLYKDILPSFKGNEYYNLTTANKVYVKTGFDILESFSKTATDAFGAEVENVDFSKPAEASGEINEWVQNKTNGKITNLISPEKITQDTRLILVNALYFNAFWEKKFDPYDTRTRAFFKTEKESIDVDTMQMIDKFRYYEDSKLGAKLLEIPYKGSDLSMTILLPNEKEGLSKFKDDSIRDFIYNQPEYRDETVNVHLPKFTIETTIKFVPILQKNNLTLPFSDKADFSGITSKGDLYVSDVVQKTYIKVAEEGTEAAAASSLGFVLLSAIEYLPNSEVKEFIVDRPFLFAIKKDKEAVFVGRVTKPVA